MLRLLTMAKTLFLYKSVIEQRMCSTGTGKAISLSQQFLDVAGFQSILHQQHMPMYF